MNLIATVSPAWLIALSLLAMLIAGAGLAFLVGGAARLGGPEDRPGTPRPPLPSWPADVPTYPVEAGKDLDGPMYRISVLRPDGTWKPLLVGFPDFAAATRFVADSGIAESFEGYAVELRTTEWVMAYSVTEGVGTEIGLGIVP